jgi:ubiquinone/menaquinone biosynthesis C-methylase UbiE
VVIAAWFGWLAVWSAVVAAPCWAQRGTPKNDDATESKRATDGATEENPPPALTHFMGREIARTMHFAGAPWLIRDEREREERASEMIAALGVRPGQVVCDLGCGNGFHALKLAELVGKEGRVVAVDIQREMLVLLEARAKEADVGNIKTVLSLPHDPKLDEASVDLILLVDVYHEFSHPQQMLAGMRRALKKGGRIALVEFRAEDVKVPIKPEHKMSKKQILKEFPANGFKLAAEYDKLPWQHLMFFERDDGAGDDGADGDGKTPEAGSKIERSTEERQKAE